VTTRGFESLPHRGTRRPCRRARGRPARDLPAPAPPGFGFDHAAALSDYLAELGVSHAYFSPYLKAARGAPRLRRD
jgi:hypothetical protein